MTFIFVALGGAVGACARYAISLIPIKSQFPFLTLITNLLGALLIGFIVGIAESRNVSKNTMLFLKTGVCGGFTTFSTFSLEAYSILSTKKLRFMRSICSFECSWLYCRRVVRKETGSIIIGDR